MTKKEVEICDECNKKIAKIKCELCGADMCEDCESYIYLKAESPEHYTHGNPNFMKISTCEKCSDITTQVDLMEEFKNYPELKKQFIDIFIKLIQLEELEGKVRPKKEPLFAGTALTGITSSGYKYGPAVSKLYPNVFPKYKYTKTGQRIKNNKA